MDRSDGNPGSYFDADGNEIYLNPDQVLSDEVPTVVCSISVVDRSNQPTGGGYDSLSSLLYADAGIRIEPIHDYYVSALSLTTGDGSSSKNLLTAATANLDSAAVTLYLTDIAEIDGSGKAQEACHTKLASDSELPSSVAVVVETPVEGGSPMASDTETVGLGDSKGKVRTEAKLLFGEVEIQMESHGERELLHFVAHVSTEE